MLTIDTLAQEIRRVDGNHSLGAGALAEALMPFISAALSIEQAEPVAEPAWWLVATDMGKVIFNGHDKARAERVSESQGRPITPLYTHPPVSALVNAQADGDVVERMARAMCERDGFEWDAASVHQTANGEEPEQQREYWRDKADAALSSLRPAEVGSATVSTGTLSPEAHVVGLAAGAYVAEQGIEHSGGIVESAFEAGALWATDQTKTPYGYVFGGCTFLRNGSPLLTEYVKAQSMAVFLKPARGSGADHE